MRGYLNNPGAAAAFAGGWFHTGDLGYFDKDGFLFIVGRIKELIIRGGYNVYPAEIEDVLHGHPAVAEAAVIGILDDRLGEEVKAVVALRPGTELTGPELIAYCKERIAAYKYPRVVEFRDALPRNTPRQGPEGRTGPAAGRRRGRGRERGGTAATTAPAGQRCRIPRLEDDHSRATATRLGRNRP
jgi:AMP-binding enzyme C-terminal domain/AMP-binding enzyme